MMDEHLEDFDEEDEGFDEEAYREHCRRVDAEKGRKANGFRQ